MTAVMTAIIQFVVVQTRAKILNYILTTKFAKASSLKFLAIVLLIAQDDFEIVFCDSYGTSDIRPIRNLFKDDIYCVLQCDEDFIEGMMECPCQANCPDGCPCPNYICQNDDRFSLTEVLLIYQRPSENQPYPPNLINAPLSQVTEINFTWPRNINLYSACMANLNGEPHIFGGYPDAAHRSQVSFKQNPR